MSNNDEDEKKLRGRIEELVRAINDNDDEKVKFYSTIDIVNTLTKDCCFHANVTPLFLASKLGKSNIVRILLRNGAKVNTVDELGRTALQSACEENYENVVDVLLAHEADPNAGGPNELRTSRNTCLGGAIKSRNATVVQKLLESGADVNLYNELNQKFDWPIQRVSSDGSYFHHALSQSSPKIVEILCKHGCDVNVRDDNDETPLFLAVRQADIESSKILLKHGANPNAVTEQGNTLNIAAATVPINKDMIELLVENGAQLNVQEKINRVPLALYLSNFNLNQDLSIVKYLIQHGTILNESWMLKEIKWMLNRLGQFDVVKMAIEGGTNVHCLPWLRNFLESPPGRKYWYTSNNYDTEEELSFRKYVEPIISAPYSLSKICCFDIRKSVNVSRIGR